MITKEDVASRIRDYLQHRLKLDDLVAWAEQAMQEEEFETSHFETIRDTVARLGVADVRPFGLTWEECEQLLEDLGYQTKIEVYKAG